MNNAWISLAVFGLCYLSFAVLPSWRAWTACLGGTVLVLTGVLRWDDALLRTISWNIMGLFIGTLVLAELFMLSRVPAVLAEWMVDKARSARGSMLALCALSGLISMFVENVAVVLLIAPVALSLAQRLKVSPVPLLLGIAVSSNLQGTATMTGDPPSMILAGFMRMGYLDFFVYQGRPGVFFAVQIGALCSLLMLAMLFRKHRAEGAVVTQEKARSWVPTMLLVLLVSGLSISTLVDPEFAWFAGSFTLALALLGTVWFVASAKWGTAKSLFNALDWDTTFFLVGVFLLVGGLTASGWLQRIAVGISGAVGTNTNMAFFLIVTFSVLVSAVVDNVPFLLVMIPVVQEVAQRVNAPLPLLMFGLLIGACLGGNLTPIGASANVVTLGILKKRGYTVSYREFMSIGIPFTVAATVPACLFVLWVWGR